MADPIVVSCPECKKKFKPKTDVRGKKIKCPFCKVPFVVPAAKATKPDKSKPDAVKEGNTKPEPAAVAEEKKAEPYDEFDENPDPYGVKQVDLVPRCPNCTQEMGEHDVICLSCGYNTLTRTWGKTEKTLGITFGRHLLYLLPALSAVFVVFMMILTLIFYDILGPYLLESTMFYWMDHESMRLFSTTTTLSLAFSAGVYGFKKFIEQPKPDEIVME